MSGGHAAAPAAAAGLDCGSTNTKGAVINSSGQILALEAAPAGWNLVVCDSRTDK